MVVASMDEFLFSLGCDFWRLDLFSARERPEAHSQFAAAAGTANERF
jgi:hypothetical protein